MARIQNSAALLHGPDVLEGVLEIYSKRESKFYRDIVGSTIRTKQQYIRRLQKGDFGMAPIVDEAAGIPYDDNDYPFNKDYYPVKRALGFSVSSEALESDRYKVINTGRDMALAFNKTMEQVAAEVINQAANTAAPYLGPDGEPLASREHPTAIGTAANRPETDLALGALALEQAVQELADQVSHRGDPMASTGPFKLHVPTSLMGLAHRVVKATGLAGTDHHDPNWAGGLITKVCWNPYLTSTTAWCLQGPRSGVFMIQRRPFSAKMDFDIDRDVNKYVATQMYLISFDDWRDFWYTTGS